MGDFSTYGGDSKEELQALILRFENLQKGHGTAYFEEEAYEKIVEYYESQEHFKKAMKAVDLAIEQFPFSASLMVKKADLLLNNQSYPEALDLLNKAALFDNSNIDQYILKTEALLALDRHDEAVELLQLALNLFEGDEKTDLLFELADVYDDYEDFDKVFDCIKAILEQEPNNEEALYKMCFWTDFTGRNAESIALHQKIIDEFPYSELAWFNLGAAYQGVKLYEKAIDAYKYALAVDDKFDYAYRNIGDAYIRLKKYRDAIEYLEKVLELAKPEDVIFEAIAYCYEKIKNYAQARFYYRKASHMNPENSLLFYKIAQTYYREGKWEQAAKQLDTALRIKRNKPEYNLLMGECKMELGMLKEAIQYFMNVVSLKPRSVAGREALVLCLYRCGYYEEALQQAQSARFFVVRNTIFRYYNALSLFALRKNKEALIELEAGLVLSPALLKKILQVNPSLLQNQQVADLIVKYKRKRRGKNKN